MTKRQKASDVISADFQIEVDDFRAHRIPGLPNSKYGTCYIRASELVKKLELDDWLEGVNPRVPNRNAKQVLTGHVVKGIRETLQDAPEDFAIKNQGLFLLVDKIGEYQRERAGGLLELTLNDTGVHGLCNGGHTYAAIKEFAESAEDTSSLNDAWVHLHIFEGIDPEKVSVMAEGLNRSKQVDDPSLLNLEGHFKRIRKAMSDKLGEDEIAYHQGDSGSYYITEIIRTIMFFNCERFDNRRHPSSLYRQQKKMIGMYIDDVQAKPSPISLIVPRLHEILVLMDMIAEATPAAAKSLPSPFEIGRMSDKGSARAASQVNRNTSLHFLGRSMNMKIPNGWLIVMLAAFRANVDWDLKEARFDWKVPLDELLPKVIGDLVRICVQEYRDNKNKPDEMARNPSVYEQCYNKVELQLYRMDKH